MSPLFKSAALVLIVFAAGCVTTKGKKIESDQYASFVEGTTTRAEIVAALGEPESNNFVGSDEVLIYKFQKTDNKMMIPIVGPLMGMKTDIQFCQFMVGGKGAVLKNKSCGQSKAGYSALGG